MRVCPHPLGQLPFRLSWGFCTSTPESESWGFCGDGVWSGLPLCFCVLGSFQYEVGPTPPSTVKASGAVGPSWVESVLLFLTPYSAGMRASDRAREGGWDGGGRAGREWKWSSKVRFCKGQ